MKSKEISGIAQSYLLDGVVFACGAVVMTFEIIGSRIVSPFIGNSTYVWTSLIGVILAALSTGYWLGGRMADRRPEIRILSFVILLAAGLISLTTVIKDIALSMIASGPIALELKSVFASILLFAPASVALGFVTPFAVKLRISSLGEAGNTVGRLYAISTIGSIAGTFAAGFLLIPFIGSTRTLYILSAVLILLSALLVPLAATRANIGVILVFILGVSSSELMRYTLLVTKDLHDIDTEYTRVQVFRSIDPSTGRPIRALAFDPFSTQSAMFLDSDELVFEYSRFYKLLGVIRPGFERTLMIGGAGYSFPKEYLHSYPKARIDVVEIDPRMTAIARDFFRLKEDPRLRTFHEDGRLFLNRTSAEGYDAVLMDAFGSLFSVPYQLTTLEAVRNIDRVLKKDGVVIFNLGSAISGPGSLFLQAEFRTYQQVFPQVFLFKVRPEKNDKELQNLIVIACKSNCMPSAPTGDQTIDPLLARRYTADFPLGLPALTDDLAPVERYNSIARANSP